MLYFSTTGHGEQCNSWIWDGCHDWFTLKNFIAQGTLTFFWLPFIVFVVSKI